MVPRGGLSVFLSLAQQLFGGGRQSRSDFDQACKPPEKVHDKQTRAPNTTHLHAAHGLPDPRPDWAGPDRETFDRAWQAKVDAPRSAQEKTRDSFEQRRDAPKVARDFSRAQKIWR